VADGRTRRDPRTGGSIEGAAAIGSDGTVYFGSDDARLYAVAPDGQVRWTLQTRASIVTSPVIGPDGTIYLPAGYARFGAFPALLVAPDGTAQTLNVWGYDLALAPSGRTWAAVPYGAVGGYSMQWESLWYIDFPGSLRIGWLAAASDDSWRLSSSASPNQTGGAGVVRIDASGAFAWLTAVPGTGAPSPPAIDQQGTSYVVASGGGLSAVDVKGKLLWTFPVSSAIDTSPAVDEQGTTYFGADDGFVYAVAADGSRAWELAAGAAVRSSPAIGADGTIYVGTEGGRVYAIGP
jgi:outer membrane protein assembly factor BamB